MDHFGPVVKSTYGLPGISWYKRRADEGRAVNTIPLDILLNLLVGSAFAFACGKEGIKQESVRSAALLRAIGVILVTFVPFAAYYVARYADWSWMYLFPSDTLPRTATYGMLAVYVGAVWTGFQLTASSLKRGALLPARLNAVGDALLFLIITGWGWHRLMYAGTYADYQAGTAPLIIKTPLFWAVVAMGAVFLPALALMLRRTRAAAAEARPR